MGGGYYWVYAKQELFDIKIHDFFFHEEQCLDMAIPECISIQRYDSISGEELDPYRRLSAGAPCQHRLHERNQAEKLLQAAVRVQCHPVHSGPPHESGGASAHQHRFHYGANRPDDRLHTPSRFAELFKKSTGILPIEYRKIARRE